MTDTEQARALEQKLLGGYSRQQLEEAFDRVAPASSWRDRIDSVVVAATLDDRRLLDFAVRFYTATVPTFRPLNEREGIFRVTADGYRAGPAGDH